MKVRVKINLPLPRKGYPPERSYYASDLSNLVKIGVSLYGEKTYFRFKRNHQDLSLSYKDFGRMVDCVGTSFAELGLSDSAIAVIGETSPEWVITYLAAVNGGSMIVPLDKELSKEESANCKRRANVRCVVHSSAFTKTFEELEAELPDVKHFIKISKEFFP